MPKLNINDLAVRLRERRGARGIRDTAGEIGVSSATLTRVENGKYPDLQTFARICAWLDIDPSDVLGLTPSKDAPTTVAVHFRKDQSLDPKVATTLADMIIKAHKALQH